MARCKPFRPVIPVFLVSLLLLSACATTPFEATPASTNPAVNSLVNAARSDSSAYQYANAGASLERALRIEPRNARLWHELAQVRYRQEEFQQAESLAQRANRFTGDNMRLRRANWTLIEKCRRQRGDIAGADIAMEKSKL